MYIVVLLPVLIRADCWRSKEERTGMMASVFSAYGFAPLSSVFSPAELEKFGDEVANSLPSTPLGRKYASLYKAWALDNRHAQLEYVGNTSLTPYVTVFFPLMKYLGSSRRLVSSLASTSNPSPTPTTTHLCLACSNLSPVVQSTSALRTRSRHPSSTQASSRIRSTSSSSSRS